jgi:hypothetical protein
MTAKAARGVRMPGPISKDKRKRPTKRGVRLDGEQAYREGFVEGVPHDLVDAEAPVAVETEHYSDQLLEEAKRFEQARMLANTLILSGIEPRVAIMRAAGTYKVAPRALVLAVTATVSGTNLPHDPGDELP